MRGTDLTERLPWQIKLGYGTAELGLVSVEVLVELYLLKFYNVVVGLPPTYTALALALAVVWDAVSDPVMGAPRLTLGIGFLEGGIPFLPVLIGVFAFAQLMADIERSLPAIRKQVNAIATITLPTMKAKIIANNMVGLDPLSWTECVRVSDRILSPEGGQKGSCHEDSAKIPSRVQTPSH